MQRVLSIKSLDVNVECWFTYVSDWLDDDDDDSLFVRDVFMKSK